MSAKGRSAKEATLPKDPKWITIDVSDGDPSRWPTGTEPNPDASNAVNYHKPIDINHGLAIKWRNQIGKSLAEMLGLAAGDSTSWVLKDWPAGYHFFDHHKGPIENPRHDLYLFGSRLVGKFRSPNEFIPHAFWLVNDKGQNRDACQCKYCGGHQQREVSSALGLSQRGVSGTAHFTELPRVDKTKKRKLRAMREDRISGIMRRIPKIEKLPAGPSQYASPERERDLRALLAPKVRGERRWAREGELVWVKLAFPLSLGQDGSDATIRFWPGLIDEVHFRTKIVPKPCGEINMADEGKSDDAGELFTDQPWTVVHSVTFKINLIVSTKTVLVNADSVVPYQAQRPADPLMMAVQTVLFDVDKHTSGSQDGRARESDSHPLRERFEDFDPFPNRPIMGSSIQERISYSETAAGSFALAIQTASRVSSYWSPTDSWDFRFAFSGLTPELPISEGSAQLEQQIMGRRILGTHYAGEGGSLQKRFQGLWWGPERIWCGDLVRLKISREQFVPEGNAIVKAPFYSTRGTERVSNEREGGDSDSNNKDVAMDDDDVSEAASRSLFLLIDSIFVASIPREDTKGVVNECRMSGMLYELADEDWQSDEDVGAPPVSSSTLFVPNADLLSEVPAEESISAPVGVSQNATKNSEDDIPTSLAEMMAPGDERLLNFSRSDLMGLHSSIQLPSRPMSPPLSLPPPPSKLKFRPILKDGHEIVFPLTQLSGRYYPSVLNSPLLRDRMEKALEDIHAMESSSLWALEGRVAGLYNAVDPVVFLPRRSEMSRLAEDEAWEELIKYWRSQWRRDEARKEAIQID